MYLLKRLLHISMILLDSCSHLWISFIRCQSLGGPSQGTCAQHILLVTESPRRSWRSCDVDRWTLHLLCSLCHDFNTLTFTSNHYFVLFRYILLNNTRYGANDYLGHVVFKLSFFWFRPSPVKGIVHPKIKILSLITHHHVIPNS